ncbi:methyltransferase domain-containing protein [bacterium]|nr:methyltransferase domain-containing protein [bacterium]
MAGITERVYPKEMDAHAMDNIQGIMYKVFTTRYKVARDWLRSHFGSREIRILDIACGSGYGSEILSDLGEVTGVDIDKETVEYARKNYSNGRTAFLEGNADDASFLRTLGHFDAVVSLATVEHVAEPYSYMNWIRKAIGPRGAAVVCFPSVVTMDWAAPHHKRDISKPTARKLFYNTGFEIKKSFYQNHKLDIRNLINEVSHDDNQIPVPRLKEWAKYFLLNPHHLLLRIYEITIGGGVHFGDQEYLLLPKPEAEFDAIKVRGSRPGLEESYG